MENYSLADIAAATGTESCGGNSWIVLILLFAMIFNGGGMFGNNGSEAVQRAVDLNSIKEGQAGIAADIQRGIYEVNNNTQHVAYDNLSEIRDVQAAIAAGFADQQKCCCETLRAIDGVNYNNTVNTQKVLDALAQNKIDALTEKVRSLELNNAMSGIVRYPMSTTYTSGGNPFCSCGCGCNI